MANHKKKDEESKSRLLFVEPNPCSENSQTYNADREMVATEDLSILVELESISRGRSVIIAGAKDEIQNSEGKSINTVSFIDGSKVGLGKKHLTTNYTQLRGLGMEPDDDLESLGIEHIAITFDTAYTPNVKIKFIDIRGKAVLEPGAKSKYAMFFELPYPIFKLRVKGFYGKSVTYCLHLIKWNASFNSTTGNFEINAEFIGYTYAMLTDCLVGLMRAVVCTDRGKTIFKRYKDEETGPNSGIKKYPGLKTIDEFLDYQKKVEDDFKNIKTKSPAITQINALDKVSSELTIIKKLVDTLRLSLNLDNNLYGRNGGPPDFMVGFDTLSTGTNSAGTPVTKNTNNFEDTSDLINSPNFQTYPGDITKYQEGIQKRLNSADGINKKIEIDILKIRPKTRNNSNGTERIKRGKFTITGTSESYVVSKIMSVDANILPTTAKDIYQSLDSTILATFAIGGARDGETIYLYDFFYVYREIKRVEDAIDVRKKKLNNIILEQLRNITNSSEYKFTIGNVVEMFSIHAQVLLETIGKVSELAEKSSQRVTILKKQLTTTGVPITDTDEIFPWPEYKEKREKSGDKNSGYYETWIGSKLNGNQIDDIPEISFTEEILKCLMLIGKADALRELELAGVDTPQFYAINPLDATINYSDDILTGKSLITNNPYYHALMSDIGTTGNPDEAERLLLMRGFLGLSISSIAQDDYTVEFMGRFEAENLFNVILNEFDKDEVRNFSGNFTQSDVQARMNEMFTKWAIGSGLVVNPVGAKGTKVKLLKPVNYTTTNLTTGVVVSTDKYYNYTYIWSGDRKYIPISGQFDGRSFFDQSTGKMKEPYLLKNLSEDLLFTGNARGYIGNAYIADRPTNQGAGVDDGAIYLKIIDEETYEETSSNPDFDVDDTLMVQYYKHVNADLVFEQLNLRNPAYKYDATLSFEALDYYNGRHKTLEISKIKYDADFRIDNTFFKLNNSEKISNVACAYWNNESVCWVGTYLSNQFNSDYLASWYNMNSEKSKKNVDGFMIEGVDVRQKLNDTYGNTTYGSVGQLAIPVVGVAITIGGVLYPPEPPHPRYLIPENYGKQRELLYDTDANLLVPFIEFNVSNSAGRLTPNTVAGTQNFSLFGSVFYNQQNRRKKSDGTWENNPYEVEAKAFLFLHSFGWTGCIGDIIDSAPTASINPLATYGVSLFDVWNDVNKTFGPISNSNVGSVNLNGEDDTVTLKALFNTNSSFIKAPKLWCAFIGALLYRHHEGIKLNYGISSKKKAFHDILTIRDGNGVPFRIFPWQDGISNLPYFDQYFYDVRGIKQSGTVSVSTSTFGGAHDPATAGMNLVMTADRQGGILGDRYDNEKDSNGADDGFYPSIDRGLIGLPQQVKDEFIKVFKDFIKDGGDFQQVRDNYELFSSYGDQVSAWNDLRGKANNTDPDTKLKYPGRKFLKKSDIDRVFSGKEDKVKNCTNISPIPDTLWSGDTANPVQLYQFNMTYGPGKGNDLLVKLIKEEVYIMNASPMVFRNKKPLDGATQQGGREITRRTSENYITRKNGFHDVKVKATIFEKYVTAFLVRYEQLFKDWTDNVDKKNDILQKRLFNAIDDDIIKLNIYRTLASINNKWVGTPSAKLGCADITNISNTFKFLDSGFRDISDKFYINPKFLSKKIIGNYNQSFFDVVNKLLADNNFNFIPLPSFINFRSAEELDKAFKPLPYKDALDDENVGPSFICVYIGQTSTNLDLGEDSTHKDDGIYISSECKSDGKIEVDAATIPKSFEADTNNKSVNIPYFLVSYGKQNQSIFKDIKLDQREFVETAETLQIIEDISQTGDKRKPTFKGQNLFNVYQTRAYSAEVEMMGNATIQPMMYFQLNNVPMFRGAYMIISTSHDITAHNMTTKFKGVRIKETMTDLLTESELFMNLLGDIGSEGSSDIISNDGINFAGRDVDGAEITQLGLGNPLTSMTITSAFGARNLSRTNPRASSNHKGIDLLANEGTPIYAPQDGIIEYVRFKGNFGLQMQIKHEQVNDKIWRTFYGHMKSIYKLGDMGGTHPTILDVGVFVTGLSTAQIAKVQLTGPTDGLLIPINQAISKGDLIGYTGGKPGADTIGTFDFAGSAGGPHLHFETRVEVKMNNRFRPSPTDAFFNGSAAKDPSALVAANFDGTLKWV